METNQTTKSNISTNKKKGQYFRKIDFFGEEYKLSFQGADQFQTSLGAIFSFVFLIIFGFTAFSAISRLWDTKSPEVAISSMMTSEVPEMDLYNEDLSIAFGGFVFPNIVKAQNLFRYITPVATVVSLELIDEATQEFEAKVINVVPFVQCGEGKTSHFLKHYKDNPQELKIATDFGLCPNADGETGWKVKGKLTRAPMQSVQISVMPCTLDVSQCATLSELKQFQLQTSNVHKTYDASDKFNPVRYIPAFDEGIQIDVGSKKKKDVFYRLNEIWDDDMDFKDSVMRTSYVDVSGNLHFDIAARDPSVIHCTMTQVTQQTCDPYYELNLYASGRKQVVTRKYPKIITTLGEIGGNRELIFLAVFLLYKFFRDYKFYRHKRDQVSKLTSEEEIEKFLRPSKYLSPEIGTNSVYEEVKLLGKTVDTQQVQINEGQNNTYYKTSEVATKNAKEQELKLCYMYGDYFDRREDFFKLASLIDFFEIIEDSILKPHYKKLLPLLMLEKSKRKILAEKKSKSDIPHLLEHGVKQAALKLTIEEAYAELLRSQPTCELDEMVKDYFTQNLPEALKKTITQKTLTVEDKSGFDVIEITESPKQRINIAISSKSNRINRVHPSNQKSSQEIQG